MEDRTLKDGRAYAQISTMHSDCGGEVVPQFLFVASDGALFINAYCSKCGVPVYREISQEEFLSLRPSQPSPPVARPGEPVPSEDDDPDKQFLRALGIKLPTD